MTEWHLEPLMVWKRISEGSILLKTSKYICNKKINKIKSSLGRAFESVLSSSAKGEGSFIEMFTEVKCCDYTTFVECHLVIKLTVLKFLNLPFLANFYKITGMSGTYYYYQVLTNLPICNLFFAILCNLFFVNIVDLFFLIFFGKIFLPDIFATYPSIVTWTSQFFSG